ncbi:hypothetical protein R1flu_015090 [Riccia fluitans]|uniref:DUF7705 domain-containing protein n=1 Tax=Riccia fluitans TaxID=41844 RepID=A0ABD1YJ19_9MARC
MARHSTVTPWGIILLLFLALLSSSSEVLVVPIEGNSGAARAIFPYLKQKSGHLESRWWTSLAQKVKTFGKSSLFLAGKWETEGASKRDSIEQKSALGDPGMRSDKVRVAVEGWNFCNRVGSQTNNTVNPRWADCADLTSYSSSGLQAGDDTTLWKVDHKVSEADNNLKTGDSFPEQEGEEFQSVDDPDLYAVEKEKYLAFLCEVEEPMPWHFWMIMLKNGNYDVNSKLCPIDETSLPGFSILDAQSRAFITRQPMRQLLANKNGFPCFGPGCMNQPQVYHNLSQAEFKSVEDLGARRDAFVSLTGSFYGTYDMSAEDSDSYSKSYFSVDWYKNEAHGSWIFHHVLRVSDNYPWLMLYLRADATKGESGGYPWDTRGMILTVPESPNFKVIVTLNVIRGGGPQSQFYLLDIGGCWKNNGEPCNGDLSTDVTRYSEMIINPDTPAWCRPNSLDLCPPYHLSIDGQKIYRNDTKNFPYDAYHLYCAPYNAEFAEKPFRECDRYSNPQAQELLQLLPHPEWAVHGYPVKKGDGWIGDSRTWELDTGGLSSRLYFYQDPGTPAAARKWSSIDVGTEIFISSSTETAEWTLSDFNVLIP